MQSEGPFTDMESWRSECLNRRKPVAGKTAFLRAAIGLHGLLVAAGLVACAATVAGFVGRFHWALDLFSHFRVQYLLGLAALGGLLLLGRRQRTAVAFLAFACVNLAVLLPQFIGRRPPPSEPAASTPLRAMLINVNTRRGDAELVRRAVEQAAPDILVLEEVSARWMAALGWLAESHPHSVVRSREDNFGIALFSRLPMVEGEVAFVGEAGVPSILATVQTEGGGLRVVATHPLPPVGREYSRLRNDQLDKLPGRLDSELPLVLMGDLNATPWSFHFRRLARRTGLLDSSKGRKIRPTWPCGNPLLWIPLDHLLHSPEVVVLDRRVGPNVGSDHYPLVVDFVIETERNGR